MRWDTQDRPSRCRRRVVASRRITVTANEFDSVPETVETNPDVEDDNFIGGKYKARLVVKIGKQEKSECLRVLPAQSSPG